MKSIFESVIKRGGYDLGGLLKKIDSYHIEGKLTDGEKDELYRKARGSAEAANSVDVLAKLQELEERIRKLEAGEGSQEPVDEYPEYVAGKWYRAGDKITYGGQKYICTAPSGVVCTWSPEEYPAYWEEA